MKSKFFYFLVILPLLFVSCKKESSDTVKKMAATIDDKSWEAGTRVTVLQNSIFTITGTSALGAVVTITVYGEESGTYTFSATDLDFKCLGTYTPSILEPTATYTSTSGKVVLTVDKTNKTISGTFEFTVVKNLTSIKYIKNGAFNNLAYEEYSGD